MRLRNLFGGHTPSRRGCSAGGARRCRRTTRRLVVEALEQRTLLSVGPVAEFSATVQPNDPATLEASAMVAAAAAEGEVVHGPLRVSVWTEELIGNLGDWVENQTWPDVFGHGAVGREDIWEYFHQRLLSDPRGGYQTIMRIDVAPTVDSQQAADALEELDFVIFAKPESESSIRYSSGIQEALNAVTTGAAPGYTSLHGEDTWGHGDRASTEFRVTWRTLEKVTDVRDFVQREGWPDALGPISTDNVQLLLSQRLLQDARGGYLNTARIRVSGNFAALDQVSFLERAKLESESSRLSPAVQEAIDAITTGDAPGYTHLALQQSIGLIEVDDFGSDQRFSTVTGSDYAIAILDSGIDQEHAFFGEDSDPDDGIADRIVYQHDYVEDNDEADDDYGHGTHVAGIAASEDGTYEGVAPGAKIIALKIADEYGDIAWADVQTALQWVVDNAEDKDIAAVNMSLGSGNYTSEQTLHDIDDELEALANLGVIVVSSSGNDYYNLDAQGVSYPSADPHSLSIGAVYDENFGSVTHGGGAVAYSTDADRIAAFSQRDDDLTTAMAPGSSIISAAVGGGTTDEDGTSMAAPHVAGMALLAQQVAVDEWGRMLTPAEFAKLLKVTGTTVNDGDDEDDNVDNTTLDFPRVNMFALAEAIVDGHWEFDADDDPAAGDQADDGTPDSFEVKRVGDDIQVLVNSSLVQTLDADDVLHIVINGSSDVDTFRVRNLGDFVGSVELDGGTGTDVVYLWDTIGDDRLVADADWARMTMDNPLSDTVDDAYFVEVDNRYSIYAYATAGGTDRADLHDSSGNDNFEAYPTYARLYGTGFYNKASYFESAYGHATSGGTDRADLYDSSGDDDLYADPDSMRLEGTGFYNKAWYFDSAYAHATAGGEDRADLYDSSGDDTFDARPDYAKMEGAGFYNKARYFERAYGHATAGGTDRADLYDSSGDDDLYADPNFMRLEGTGFYNKASYFESAYAHATAGGEDRADLYDSSGDDNFDADPDYARLEGTGFYNKAWYFESVYGYAVAGGTDQADLYDSAGDDLLEADDEWAKLSSSDLVSYVVWIYDFDPVDVYASDGDDTTDITTPLDFQLNLNGDWD